MGITNLEITDLKLGDDAVDSMLLGNQRVWPVEGSYLEFDVPDPNNDLSVHTRGNAVRFSTLFDNWRAGFIVAVSTEVGDQTLGSDAETPEEEGVGEIVSISEKPFNVSQDGRTSIFVDNQRPKNEGTLLMTGTPERFDGSIWFKTDEYINDGSSVGIKRWSGNNAAWLGLNDTGSNPIYTITRDIALVWRDLVSTIPGELSGLYGQGIAYISGGEMNDFLNQELQQAIDIASNTGTLGLGVSWDSDDWSLRFIAETFGETSFNSFLKKSLLSAGWGNNPGTNDSVKVWYGNSKPSGSTHRSDGEGYSLYDFYYDTDAQKLFRLTEWKPLTFPSSNEYDGLYDATILIDAAGSSVPQNFNSAFWWTELFLKQDSSWILPKPTSIAEWNNLNYYGQAIAARCLDNRSIQFTWTDIGNTEIADTFAQGISSVNPVKEPTQPISKTSFKLFFDVPIAAFANSGFTKSYLGKNQYQTWPGKSTTYTEDIIMNITRPGTVPYNFRSGNNLIKYNYSGLARITPEAMDEVIELDSLTQYQFESIKTIKIRNNRKFYDGIGELGSRAGGYPNEDSEFPIAWPVGNGTPWGIKSPVGGVLPSPDFTLATTSVLSQAALRLLNSYDSDTKVKGEIGLSLFVNNTRLNNLVIDMPPTDQDHFKPLYRTGTFFQPGAPRNSSVNSLSLIESDLSYKEYGKYWADPFTEQYDAVQTRRMADWFPLGTEVGGSGGTGKVGSDLYPVKYGIPFRIWEGLTLVPHDGTAVAAEGYSPMEYFWPGDEEKDDIEITTDITANGCRKITATIPLPQNGESVLGFIGHRIGSSIIRANRYDELDLAFGRVAIYYINRSPDPVTVTATLIKSSTNQVITRTVNVNGNNRYDRSQPQIDFTGLESGSYVYTVSDGSNNRAEQISISVGAVSESTVYYSKYNSASVNAEIFRRFKYRATRLSALAITLVLPLPPTVGKPDINVKIIPIDLEKITRLLPAFDDYYSDSDRGPLMYFYDHDFWYTTDPYSNGYRRPFFSFMPYKQAATFTPNSEVLLVFFPFSKQELEQGYFNLDPSANDPWRYSGTDRWRFYFSENAYINEEIGNRWYIPPADQITPGTQANGVVHPEMKIAGSSIDTSVLYDSQTTIRQRFGNDEYRFDPLSPASIDIPEIASGANNEIYGPIVCDYNDGWGTGLPRRKRLWDENRYVYPNSSYRTYKGTWHQSGYAYRIDDSDNDSNIDVPMQSLWPTALVLTTDASGRINGIKHNGTQPLNSNNNPADFTGALMFDYAARAEWTEDPWFTVCQTLSAGRATSKGDTLFDDKFNNDIYKPLGGVNEGLSVTSAQVIDIKQATPYYRGDRYRTTFAEKLQLANAYIFDGASNNNYGYNLQTILNNQEFPSTAHKCAFISNGMVGSFGESLNDIPEEDVFNMGVPDTLVGVEFEDFTSGRYPSVLDKDSTDSKSGWLNNFYFGGVSFPDSFQPYQSGNSKPTQQFTSNRPLSENGDTRYYLPPYGGYYSGTTRTGWATQTGIKNIKCKNLSKLLFIKDAGSTDVLQFPLPTTYEVSSSGWKEACKGVLNQLKAGSQITVEGCSNFQYAIPGSAVLFSKTDVTTVNTNVDFG